jgi:hypothetical protein
VIFGGAKIVELIILHMDPKIWSHLVFASRPTSFRDLYYMVASVRNCVVTKRECLWTMQSSSDSRVEGRVKEMEPELV